MHSLPARGKRPRRAVLILLAVALLATGCGGDAPILQGDVSSPENPNPTSSSEPTAVPVGDSEPDTDDRGPAAQFGDGSLGTVTVSPGNPIQIRSFHPISVPGAPLGVSGEQAAQLAVADYGDIKGFTVNLGETIDDLCTPESGTAVAVELLETPDVVGVIGPVCSLTVPGFIPILGDAGGTAVSPTDSSIILTTQRFAPGYPGYYQTSPDGASHARVMADFLINERGVTRVSVVQEDDAFLESMATAFTAAMQEQGGEVGPLVQVSPSGSFESAELDAVAEFGPQAVFLALYPPLAELAIERLRSTPDLADTTLTGSYVLVQDAFWALDVSDRLLTTAGEFALDENVNQGTNQPWGLVVANYLRSYGERPTDGGWAYSYDAATLLLDAIDASSQVGPGGELVIDRAGIRAFLDQVEGYQGLTGSLTCDSIGDCGAQKIIIVERTNRESPSLQQFEILYRSSE